ncbi:MAG: hypothetical protein Q8P57_05400 [Candidatus Pacearchaeota archaeon]|nr:hypothetical protein [Candidatus Pacearchaeota archaeon]
MKKENKYLVGFAVFIFAVIFIGSFYGLNVFESPPIPAVGTTTLEQMYSISTGSESFTTEQFVSGNVYAFDGAGGFAWDFDGDNKMELVYSNGERWGYIDDDGTELIFDDGLGTLSWRGDGPHVVRVGENKYVAVVLDDFACGIVNCPAWYHHKFLSVYSMFDDANYNMGQKIASVQFNSAVLPANAPVGMWTWGDVVVNPGESGFVFVGDRNLLYMQRNTITVDLNGIISFTSGIGEIITPDFISCQGCAVRSNGVSMYEFCRVDENGINTGNCEDYLLTNDIHRVFDMTKVASWLDLNGLRVPYTHPDLVSSGQEYLMDWNYVTGKHTDSSLAFNAGTYEEPDYRLLVMDDNGVLVSAQINVDINGNVALSPAWAGSRGDLGIVKCSANVCATNPTTTTCTCGNIDPDSLALGRLDGLSGGPYVVDGALVYDAKSGNLVADMNSFASSESVKYALNHPEITDGIVRDNDFVFKISSFSGVDVLQHAYPEVVQVSSPALGSILRYVSPGPFNPALEHTYDLNYGGYPRSTDEGIEIDSLGNVYVRFLNFWDQQHVSFSKFVGEVPILTISSQGERDMLLANLQEAWVVRGSDSWKVWEDLGALQAGQGPEAPSNFVAVLNQ